MKAIRLPAVGAFLAVLALVHSVPAATDAPAKLGEAPLVENLKGLKNLNRRIVSMAKPSVAATVSLVAKGGGGAGSGVVVSEDGIILTAAHVIAAMGDEVVVIFADGTRKTAKALGADFDRDAAMAKITEEGTYPHVELGDSEVLMRNDWCVALGHPGGYDPTRTPPVRLGRLLREGLFLITDSAVVGGDSGGPLFDADGRLIGIHSNIGATLMENRHVPISVYKNGWDDLRDGKRKGTRFNKDATRVNPNRPVLGVQLGGPSENAGVEVEGVIAGSPASKAGLRKGDIITAINDKEVGNREELIKTVGKFKPGKMIKIAYRRDGEAKEVDVKLVRLRDLARGGERNSEPGAPDAAEKKSGEASREKNDDEGAEKLDEEELKKRLADAMKSGQLELTPQQLEQFGGLQKLHEMLREMAKDLDPEARVRFESQAGSPDPFYAASAKAITPVTRKAEASTVAVHLDAKPVALGTVVSSENWIVTKDAETRGGEVTVEVDGVSVPARLLKRFPKRDLALFQVEAAGLKPVRWRQGKKALPLGSLLTSSSANGEPLGFGLLSVKTRALSGIGFLGIAAGEAESGVRIDSLVKGGAAEKAGLRRGDVITAVDGKSCPSSLEFGNRIRGFAAGRGIGLSILRGKEKLEVKATLGERRTGNDTARFRQMNKMSGPMSERTGGFPMAIQHDIPLRPPECGGPLLDLGGRCLGINVSRAGRVKTFAIPAEDVKELLAEVQVQPPSETAAGSGLTNEECDAILESLEQLQRSIEEIEERIRTVRPE